jgi:peptidoglycan/LPS O-acetylase OafA/YrhL
MTAAAPARVASLDGLRGVASVAVVFHHLVLMTPGIAAALWPVRDSTALAVVWRGFTFPLHLILSAGLEFVFVFFVLSGVVLTIPALRASRYSWAVYYPRRLIRLCLPVLASIAVATALLLAVPRYPIAGQESQWLSAGNSLEFSIGDLLATLNPFGPSQPFNNPLWTLGWEIVFSLLLPVGVLVAVALRGKPRAAALVVVGCLVVTTIGSILGIGAATYLPMFLAGVVLAASLPALRDRFASFQPSSRLSSAALVIICLGLVSVPWIASAINGRLYAVTVGFALLGCIGLVVLALNQPWLASVLEWRPIRWLGMVSFSLYLIHVPVLVTTAFLVGPDRPFLYIPIGLAASLAAAYGFYRAVEAPSHKLARYAGFRIENATRSRETVAS